MSAKSNISSGTDTCRLRASKRRLTPVMHDAERFFATVKDEGYDEILFVVQMAD